MRSSDLDLHGKRTGQLKTTCPLCSHTRKKSSEACLSVDLSTGGWSCYNCEQSGWLEDIAQVNGSAFVTREKKVYKKPVEVVPELPQKVLDWFAGRGISEETVKAFKIRFGPAFRRIDPETKKPLMIDGVPQFRKAIQFPFYEDGELVWLKNLFPREWAPDGVRRLSSFTDGKPVPFALDMVENIGVLTEGEPDTMACYEAGIRGAFSVPNGAKAMGWLEFPSVVRKLMQLDKLIICVDNDPAGRKLQENLIRQIKELIGPQKIFLVEFPEDVKDANEALMVHGPEYLKTIVEDMCFPLPIDGISEASEFFDEFMGFYDNGVPKGISTGIKFLDPLYRVMPGMMTTVTGLTSQGKSELIDEIVRNMIYQEGWKFAFYTPENNPHSLHMIKLAEKHIGKPFDTERFGAMNRQEAAEAAAWINDNLFYINPHGKTYSVDEILDKARVLIYRKGIQGLIIDPWNYVRKDFGGLREDQYINQELQKIGMFCKETGLHVWLIVHPRTMHKTKDGVYPLPQLNDLSGGSKFGDNTDFGLSFERVMDSIETDGIHKSRLHVIKSRYKYAATLGNVEMEWEPGSGRFKAIGEPVLVPMGDYADIPDVVYEDGEGQVRPTSNGNGDF